MVVDHKLTARDPFGAADTSAEDATAAILLGERTATVSEIKDLAGRTCE